MDWTISTIKLCAKHELKKSYWLSLGVILVGNLISGAYAIFYYIIPSAFAPVFSTNYPYYSPSQILPGFSVGLLIYYVIAALYGIFVSGPIRIGVASFFINSPRGQRNFENLFSAFKKERYLSSVKAIFARDIRLFLWSLLSIVPSAFFLAYISTYSYSYETIIPVYMLILLFTYAAYVPYYIKSLQWYMVPYIIADNPDIDPKNALELSTRMTDGQKGKMFGLMLSFIGWYILGYFACCIGIVFVTPYPAAAFAHLYFARKGEIPVDTSTPYPQYMPYPQYPQYQYPPQNNWPGYAPQPGSDQEPPTIPTPE